MATRSKTRTTTKTLKTGTNPLAEIDDGLRKDFQRPSEELIYESVMRGGGEPFGAPFVRGISSLTEKIVKFFKQRSWFGFETFEHVRAKRSNRFTRHGASRFFGQYDLEGTKQPRRRKRTKSP